MLSALHIIIIDEEIIDVSKWFVEKYVSQSLVDTNHSSLSYEHELYGGNNERDIRYYVNTNQ